MSETQSSVTVAPVSPIVLGVPDVLSGRDGLIPHIAVILDLSASADYSGIDKNAKVNVYRDGSVAYTFNHYPWVCERRFFGGGLRAFPYIISEGKSAGDITTVTLRDKVIWHMYCHHVFLSPGAFSEMTRCEILMKSFALKPGVFDSRVHQSRGTPRFNFEHKFVVTREQIGNLGHFSCDEQIYNDRDVKIGQGVAIGGFED